ncbi:FtsK/SpoIIIE domain-containing protein [Acetobacterium carbinolicum]|uniref:FtsK/SpoIIIE domain-containing protein n=1 Tax=Acetobacterium carbinolicum TaxID=52690 RepID=UPI0039BFC8FF
MMKYKKEASYYHFLTPSAKIIVLGVMTLVISVGLQLLKSSLSNIFSSFGSSNTSSISSYSTTGIILFIVGIILIAIGIRMHMHLRNSTRIKYIVKKGLFYYAYGNPLHLKEGEKLPALHCINTEVGKYELILSTGVASVEDLQKLSTNISACLNNRYKRYAVTQTRSDLAFNTVSFLIEDVTIDRNLRIKSSIQLKSGDPTRLPIQQGMFIDLTTSGSILVAGKTRSGKTTGIISILLSALSWGRDQYGSEIIIIDPKQAELSRLPYTYTLDHNGEAQGILHAISNFESTIKKRQQILNDLSMESGDAVKWFEIGMHASFLFIDEYVSCRSLFPRKNKDTANYNIDLFDNAIKRIVTMGASAGCFVILSIAEASVESGGLPSMLRSAMSTKILFRPTLPEARLLWDSELLNNLNTGRTFQPGDAWFSSTDGVNDTPCCVHFPIMEFPIYKELGKLIEHYYKIM